jgi:hypothetical protein
LLVLQDSTVTCNSQPRAYSLCYMAICAALSTCRCSWDAAGHVPHLQLHGRGVASLPAPLPQLRVSGGDSATPCGAVLYECKTQCMLQVPVFYYSGQIIERLGVERAFNLAMAGYVLRLCAYIVSGSHAYWASCWSRS